MEIILAITNSTSSTIKLIVCENTGQAIDKMKKIYNKLCKERNYDYYNTYIDEESGYAQIVNGLEQTEFRIGNLSM